MGEPQTSQHETLEGMGLVGAILFALFLLAYAVFDTWAEWGPNGPVNEWTNIPMLLLAYCGVTQMVYVVPCYFYFRKKGKPKIAKGVLLGAVLILVVNLVIYFLWARG